MRTRTAHLGELNDEGKTIRVTYWPHDQVFQFKVIGGEPGKLPRTYTLADLWSLVRQAEEKLRPEKRDSKQLEHPVLVGGLGLPLPGTTWCAEVSPQVPDTILPETSPEIHEGQDLHPLQEQELGTEIPAEVCIQESPEPGEAAGKTILIDVQTVQGVRGGVRLFDPEGQVLKVSQYRPDKPRARIYGVEYPSDPVGHKLPPVPLQDAPVDEGRDGESRAGVA